MITILSGTLVDIAGNSAIIDGNQGLTYEVLLPVYATQSLATNIGENIAIHTIFYLEGQNQGSSFAPRLIGFRSPQERAFFETFTTVKGIGPRKALKALALPPEALATAISDRDTKTLQSLPEIGKKMAETIVVTLQDKVSKWANAIPSNDLTSKNGNVALPEGAGRKELRDATDALVALGEDRLQAIQLIELITNKNTNLETAEAILEAVYAYKESSSS